MQHFKIGLRIWIALSSVLGFLSGWALLAHSPKPAQPSQHLQPVQVQPVSLPPLPPMPSFDSGNTTIQQMPVIPQSSFIPQSNYGYPSMRTGGS